jgi:hypothetical protein
VEAFRWETNPENTFFPTLRTLINQGVKGDIPKSLSTLYVYQPSILEDGDGEDANAFRRKGESTALK